MCINDRLWQATVATRRAIANALIAAVVKTLYKKPGEPSGPCGMIEKVTAKIQKMVALSREVSVVLYSLDRKSVV